MRTTPACKRAQQFVKAREKRVLAPFTGQDMCAFEAFAHLLDLYTRADVQGQQAALVAMHATIHAMQPSTRKIAKLAIPGILDWHNEEPLWATIMHEQDLSHQPGEKSE